MGQPGRVSQPGRRVPRRTRRPAAQRPPTLRRAEPDSRADGRNTPRPVSRKRCQALTTNPGEDPHSRHAGRPPYCSIRADSAALYGQTRQRTPYPGPPPRPACTGRPGWTAQCRAHRTAQSARTRSDMPAASVGIPIRRSVRSSSGTLVAQRNGCWSRSPREIRRYARSAASLVARSRRTERGGPEPVQCQTHCRHLPEPGVARKDHGTVRRVHCCCKCLISRRMRKMSGWPGPRTLSTSGRSFWYGRSASAASPHRPANEAMLWRRVRV